MASTHSSVAEVLSVLHEQESTKINLEVLEEHCSLVDDWQADDGSFPCVALNNGVRWFYDKTRRPSTKSGSALKALSPTGKRSLLGDLEGDGDLVIFEGERDWLTALSIGISNAVCAGGADNVDEQQRHYIARRTKVTVFFDNDEAGQEAARKMCAQLVDIGAGQVKNAKPPVAGQDFAEWVEPMDVEQAPGIVLKKIREADKMGKREAKKILKEQDAADAITPMSDEFKTPDGDLVVLTYEYNDPTAPHDQEQGLDIRFAHFDVESSKKTGVRVVNFSDEWENTPAAGSDEAPIYRPEGDTPNHAPEQPAVVRPLRGNWVDQRVILFPTGVKDYETSEQLFDNLLAFIDRYYVCDDDFRYAMAAYVLLTYRYRDAGFETVPYIRVMGPPGYGKTRFLRVMRELSYRSAFLTSMRPPHLYRMLAQMSCGVTMILEEMNVNERSEDGKEFINMLNAGNQRGAVVPRMTGHNFSDMEFLPVFCPKVLTLKTEFSDTGMIRRCITGYAVPRDVPEEKKFAKLPDSFYAEGDDLRRQLLDWRFAKFLEPEAPGQTASDGLNMGIWQNWYPVIAMVPASRPQYREAIMKMAGIAEDGLDLAHQSSPEAVVLASCIRTQDDRNRAWVHLVLADLNETDRNERWRRDDVLRVIRSLGIKPKRSKVQDAEGGTSNEFFVTVDSQLEAVVSRFRFKIEVLQERPAPSDEVM